MSHLSIETLSASLDGALTGPALEKAVAHLSGCHDCSEHQARMARNDELLRGLLASEPDDRRLDELARRSEALVTAIVRGLPVPPIVAATPPGGEDERNEMKEKKKDSGTVERLARFQPPPASGPATVKQDPTATPASGGEQLPPPRDPSRAMTRPGANTASSGAPLDVTPRFDMERAPTAKAEPTPDAKTGRPADKLVESYDAFNDHAYHGPNIGGRLPPTLGRPQEKTPADAEGPPPKREYRHGGVRRDAPEVTGRAGDTPARGAQRSQPEPPEDVFGVRRTDGPAWARLGLEPDPSSPGMFRETLTGARVAPPPVGSRRTARHSASRGSRTGLIVVLATVAGLVAVALTMRLNHLTLQFGHPAPPAPAPSATSHGLDVRGATTRPPVDAAVPPQATGGPATSPETPRICGQVVDTKGRPVAGVLFTVASTTAQVRSDAAGHFCLTAPAGTQIVDIMDPRGTGTATRRIRVDFVAGAPEARILLP